MRLLFTCLSVASLALCMPRLGAQTALWQKNLDSSDIILAVRGADTTSHLGTFLTPLGDINHDGYADIAASTIDPYGNYIYFGGATPDTLPDGFLSTALRLTSPMDLNGDGIRDIAGSTVHQLTQEPWIRGTVYFFEGFTDSFATMPYDSLHPDSTRGFGEFMDVGYVDGDSLADFLVGDPNQVGGARFYFYSGLPFLDKEPDWQYAVQNYSHANTSLGFIDFNGDGWQDIFLGLPGGLDTVGQVMLFYGPNFASTPDLVFGPHAGYSEDTRYFALNGAYDLSDVDGDGWDDLCVLWGTTPFIYLGGPAGDKIYDYLLVAPHRFIANVGDVNNDGFADIAAGGTGRFFDGSVEIYLGGDKLDTTFDDYMRDSDLPPWFLNRIGYYVAPVGDFNGDGIDDFMFSANNFAFGYRGAVFVIGGTSDITTPVEEGHAPILPDRTILEQNYPNPFNPTTTIGFALSVAGYTEITVYNTLGERVTTLIRRWLPAGSHTVGWDGTDASGDPVASGVYLYQLSSGEAELSRKMVLVR